MCNTVLDVFCIPRIDQDPLECAFFLNGLMFAPGTIGIERDCFIVFDGQQLGEKIVSGIHLGIRLRIHEENLKKNSWLMPKKSSGGDFFCLPFLLA